jgi:2-polyprenyl-3-methyl-5-hydroxy-6-metoxy-1,4-benzoquinol methylase
LVIPSGEHFSPNLGLELDPYLEREDKQGIHHLSRYHWARLVLQAYRPKSVLDIACGVGYGSYILATGMPQTSVTGVDYDHRAINHANQQYINPNLSYRLGNLVTWKFGPEFESEPMGIYDAVVSFDTIEHLDHREIALIRLTENLSDNGMLLLSTPCGHEETLLYPDQPHHTIEYSYHDLTKLLRRFFQTVHLPEDGTLPQMDFWEDVVNQGRMRYKNLSNPVMCLGPRRF